MTARPITVREPTIAALSSGKVGRLRRPARGLLSRCLPGEVLWVREPFHFEARFDHLAPTVAVAKGAKPLFATDFPEGAIPAGTGKRQFARNLPRVCHRQHLEIVSIEPQQLHAITDEEIAAEGFTSREAYAAEWDRNLSLNGRELEWVRNPAVITLTFRHFSVPAKGLDL